MSDPELLPAVLEQATMEQQARIGALLLSCVAEHVQTLNRIAGTSGTPEFLEGQDARGIAAIYREIGELVIRLMEASNATL